MSEVTLDLIGHRLEQLTEVVASLREEVREARGEVWDLRRFIVVRLPHALANAGPRAEGGQPPVTSEEGDDHA